MSTLELNGKDFATQTSSAEPVLASTVTGGAGLSGSTSLGTVTTGTLGSSVVFPSGTGASHGHVLQVVLANTATPLTDTSQGLEDLGLSASLTPLSATNKVLIQIMIECNMYGSNRGYGIGLLRDDGGGYEEIYRSGSDYDNYQGGSGGDDRDRSGYMILDTPGVTVATTYKVQVANYTTNTIIFHDGGNHSFITLMEIVA